MRDAFTLALRDSTFSDSGITTGSSSWARASQVSPAPSLPISSATPPLRSACGDVIGQHQGLNVLADLKQQPLGALAGGFAEKDGVQAKSAANGIFDQADTLDRDVAARGRLGLGEGAAQLLAQRVLAAGYGVQAAARQSFHEWCLHKTIILC